MSMRVLALSDIHGRVAAVERLREIETNRFDAVVVAGDIGSEQAPAIMAILATFDCPVLYVYGNWDSQLAYELDFGERCRHLHHRGINVEGLFFTGFSGLPTHWGQNPIAAALEAAVEEKHHAVLTLLSEAEEAYAAAKALTETKRAACLSELAAATTNKKTKAYTQRVARTEREAADTLDSQAATVGAVKKSTAYRAYLKDGDKAFANVLHSNRTKLAALVQELGPRHTIVVTHERLTHTSEDMNGVPLFLLGHRHGYEDKLWGGSRFVNVSALDQLVFVAPKTDDGSPDKRRRSLRIADVGSYVVLNIDGSGRTEAESRPLRGMPDGWVRLRGSAITPDRPPMLEQPELPRLPTSMLSLPKKLL